MGMMQSAGKTVCCLEPAKARDPESPAPAGTTKGDYVVKVSSDESILFPAVDSCMAIAFVLNNGDLIGGHIGMDWGNEVPALMDRRPGYDTIKPFDLSMNARIILNEMLIKKGDKTIMCTFSIADTDWSPVAQNVSALLRKTENYWHFIKGKMVDVLADNIKKEFSFPSSPGSDPIKFSMIKNFDLGRRFR
jgi:hypothetical protein